MHNFKCQRCGECCKRYYIISLPNEVERQAGFLGLSTEDFMARHMLLFLQLFPAGYDEGKLTLSSAMLPNQLASKISDCLNHEPEYFVTLPMLVFKREEDGCCIFFDRENSACTIYPARPAECRLFPFVSDKKGVDYAELYPFCHGIGVRDGKVSYADLSHVHFSAVSEYFGEIREKGFSRVWKSWPREGVLLLRDRLVSSISEHEFFQALGPYA